MQLDPSHYESRRLRAFTCYASRKYDRLQDDALVLTVLRPRDPLGYSLRAVAWRQLSRYPEAIADYDIALALTAKDSPAHTDLSVQRSETLLRMGEYERVIAEAPVVETQDVASLQYHMFCALTALGDYDKASALFRQIISPGHDARSQFQDWCMKYVFDTLEAGRSWHPPEREPSSAAFLPLVEAQETYRGLAAKGKRLTVDGFSACWSPDGKKLAFSMGVQGTSGVAVFDLVTTETDLLIVPGKDPAWSPDGKHIAFVRDRQKLRLEELATAEQGYLDPPVTDEEVWVMNSHGTEPRRLAPGSWPSWSRDSEHVYCLLRREGTLRSVSLAEKGNTPKQIAKCADSLPAVSPDHRQVAHFGQGALTILDLASQTSVARCTAPFLAQGNAAWSPGGDQVCLGGGNTARQRTGLWLYDLPRKEFRGILDGQIQSASWSPDGTALAFCLGPPYNEVWVARLGPDGPTAEALGACRTLEEHYRQMVGFYTRRIQADPMDADAYLRRAQQYHYLHQEARVRADMGHYTAIMTQGTSSQLGMPWNAKRVINAPFGYQLIASVEERDHGNEVLSVAFGQKGRANMRSIEIPLFVASLVGLGLLSGLDAPPAHADFTFSEPARVSPPLSPDADTVECLSYDGLEMYITSVRSGGQGGLDLWVLKRASKDEEWGPPQNLGPLVNSTGHEESASISSDGLTLYFDTYDYDREGRWPDIYMTTRPSRDAPWGPAVNLGSAVNHSSAGDVSPRISPDGLELYFSSYRSGGYGRSDIYVSRRATTDDPWGQAVNLGPVVNSVSEDIWCCISPDGLALFFSDNPTWGDPPRPGGRGGCDMWMTRRASLSSPWETPTNLGPKVNGSGNEMQPRVSPDGRTLYFCAGAGGASYQASILPILDFDGDGKVDDGDVTILRVHWGRDYPPCDIGPFAWGDGVVDVEDLNVLMAAIGGTECAFEPVRHALDVPREVILSWTTPKSSIPHDVYFGTSFEDVNSASRNEPLGVLVSQGRTATTYDPEGLLAYGQTYYWRIDEVGDGPGFTIYRGQVLDFTTESYAYPIGKVVAIASSSESGWGPEKTVDGSGLDKNDGHSTNDRHMWLSSGWAGVQPAWIQYEFDAVYTLHEMWVWNHNLAAESFLGFGCKNVSVQYSANGTDWTTLGDVEFAQATGKDGYAHNTTVSFDGVPAKYVRLTAKNNWSGATMPCGLSEVRFFYVPLCARQPTPASARKGVDVDADLSWRPGRTAASHQVYFGSDKQAVASGAALVATTADTRFDPGSLSLGVTYYWRVNEVNEAGSPSVREGDLWSFSTRDYIVVDDFESYTNDSPNRIFQTWTDGAGFSPDEFFPEGDTGNGTTSTVGYDPAKGSIMEKTVVHSGRQAMPIEYNNVNSPFYAEVERTFDPPQDWTPNGADTLTLYFRGNPIDFLQRADGSIQMSGGGADIWGTSDQFRFAYKRLKGDGAIVAKIHTLIDTSPWAKAGVMIRGTLDPTSEYAFMLPTPDGRRAFQYRTATGGSAISAHSDVGTIKLPLWLKVERKGDQFTGYYSHDGKNWTVNMPDNAGSVPSNSANPVWITMAADVYVGLAVTSHSTNMPTVAEFSDVSFTGTVTGQWQVEAIGVEQPSNDLAPLYIAVEDNAGHVKTIAHADPNAVQAIDWQKWLIPLSDFQGVNLTTVEKLSIGVGDRANPTPGGTGVIYIDDIGFGHPLSSE